MPVELLNAIPVAPDLMAAALTNVSRAAGSGRIAVEDIAVIAAATYAEFYGHDDENPVSIDETEEIMALTRRVIALAQTLPRLGLESDPDSFPMIAEAACTARLLQKDGVPCFQPLDLLSRIEEAKRCRRP